MPARNGVTAAIFAQLGFTGVRDPFYGRPNYLYFFSRDVSKPKILIEGLGSYFEIMYNTLKKYSVGGPIQAPLDALLLMMEKHKFSAGDVAGISVHLSKESMYVINNRDMPNINLQYLFAVVLLDGAVTYETTMSFERMTNPAVQALKKLVKLVHEPKLDDVRLKRQAIVEVVTKNGDKWSEHVENVRGTPGNPMTRKEVEEKYLDLTAPILGKNRANKLAEKIWNLEKVSNMQKVQPLLAKGPS